MSELPTLFSKLLNSTFSFIHISNVTYKDLSALPPLAGNTGHKTPVALEKKKAPNKKNNKLKK